MASFSPLTPGLSKWVRQRLQHQSSFSQAMSSLRSFAETMMKTDVTILDASTRLRGWGGWVGDRLIAMLFAMLFTLYHTAHI